MFVLVMYQPCAANEPNYTHRRTYLISCNRIFYDCRTKRVYKTYNTPLRRRIGRINNNTKTGLEYFTDILCFEF